MGDKDNDIWLYMLCITQLQEKGIIQYFKKRKWKTDSFIRVPESHLDVVIGILKGFAGSAVFKNCQSQSAGVQADHAYSSGHRQFEVNNAVFQQVGIFEEVLRLAEVCHSTADTELVKTREIKRRSNRNQYKDTTENRTYGAQRQNSDISDGNSSLLSSSDEIVREKESSGAVTRDADNKEESIEDVVNNRTCNSVGYDSIKTCGYESVMETAEQMNNALDNDANKDYSSVIIEDDENSFSVSVDEHIEETCNGDICNDNTDDKISEARSSNVRQTTAPRGDAREINGANGKSSQRSKRNRKNKLKCLKERRERFKCDECGKVMASEQFYERHVMLMHSQEAVEKRASLKKQQRESKLMQSCQICQKQFVDRYGLQAHMASIHGEAKMTYQCDLCGAVLKFKGSLVQHMKSVHTDKRPYSCDICNKQFKVPHQLKNHRRRHDPDYIETCITCGKTMKKGQLSGHMKRHANIRPYKCASCEKSFFEKQDLERHLRIHSGEKPYKCAHCNYASTMRGNLTKHLKHVKHKVDTALYRHTDGQTAESFYTYRSDGVTRLSERIEKGTSVYVIPRESLPRHQDKSYFSERNHHHHHHHHHQEQQGSFSDPGNQQTSPDKHSSKMKHLENSGTVEVEVSTGSELGNRIHVNGVDMYPSPMHTKVILADNTHIPVSHVEISKVTSSDQSDVDAAAGLGSGYSEEATLYTLKPAGELSYVEDQRQYVEGQGEQREALPQFRENYLQYMMPHVPDGRYPYTNQY